MRYVIAIVCVAVVMSTSDAAAQATTEDRPATPTLWGDTGLWVVPSAEILPAGRWSFSFARTESDFGQGFTDVSTWPLSGAFGIANAVEVFASWRVITRVDRDTDPLFFDAADNEPGGLVNEFPVARSSWSGNQIGDTFVGGKFSLLSERNRRPFALAARATIKVPTADSDEGAGTGKMDWYLDGIVGKEFAERFEMSFFGGGAWRGNPDGVELSDGFRWGLSAEYPTRTRLRFSAELEGEAEFESNIIAAPDAVVGEDGSVAPIFSNVDTPLNLTAGVVWQARNGLFIDSSVVYAFNANRSDFGVDINDPGGSVGFQVRIGWHRGVLAYAPPPPTVAAVPAPVAPVANRAPSVAAACNPCVIETGQLAGIRATGQDPDGDTLTFRWSAPAGTVADPSATTSTWSAPDSAGRVPLTVTVDDGRGGVASATVMVTVQERAVATTGQGIQFEDVLFDLDQYTLRPDAVVILRQAVNAMRQDPTLRLQVDGHACDLGTSEYNLALSNRRANSVKVYLVSQGIPADRISIVGYGEERPINNNATEALRRLNRRAALSGSVQR